jgi:hypothetical protein
MSIHVSITRRAEPDDADGPTISPAEWLAVVSLEADFREPELAEAEWAGAYMRVWMGHPEGPVHFDWLAGDVDVRNPDELMIARMKVLAIRLNAQVFCETGEIYDASGASAGFLDGYPR